MESVLFQQLKKNIDSIRDKNDYIGRATPAEIDELVKLIFQPALSLSQSRQKDLDLQINTKHAVISEFTKKIRNLEDLICVSAEMRFICPSDITLCQQEQACSNHYNKLVSESKHILGRYEAAHRELLMWYQSTGEEVPSQFVTFVSSPSYVNDLLAHHSQYSERMTQLTHEVAMLTKNLKTQIDGVAYKYDMNVYIPQAEVWDIDRLYNAFTDASPTQMPINDILSHLQSIPINNFDEYILKTPEGCLPVDTKSRQSLTERLNEYNAVRSTREMLFLRIFERLKDLISKVGVSQSESTDLLEKIRELKFSFATFRLIHSQIQRYHAMNLAMMGEHVENSRAHVRHLFTELRITDVQPQFYPCLFEESPDENTLTSLNQLIEDLSSRLEKWQAVEAALRDRETLWNRHYEEVEYSKTPDCSRQLRRYISLNATLQDLSNKYVKNRKMLISLLSEWQNSFPPYTLDGVSVLNLLLQEDGMEKNPRGALANLLRNPRENQHFGNGEEQHVNHSGGSSSTSTSRTGSRGTMRARTPNHPRNPQAHQVQAQQGQGNGQRRTIHGK